jgi:predicted acyltransferase
MAEDRNNEIDGIAGLGGEASPVRDPQPIVIESPIHGLPESSDDAGSDDGADADAVALRRRRTRGRRQRGATLAERGDTARAIDEVGGMDEAAAVAPQPSPAAPAGASTGDAAVVAPPAEVRTIAPPELATGRPRRAFSLDALRGLFLLAMTVGFTIRGDFFPLWMYHRQFPPPDYSLVPVAGLGWRDITYVAFLFTMAAALPLTLSRLIARGEQDVGIIFKAVKRYGLLLIFALLIGHSNTYFTGYTQATRALGILGFVIMALVFTRRREDWNPSVFRAINVTGWVMAIAFLALSPVVYGQAFSFTRIDDVIAGLAFAALAGSVVWYLTRDNLVARLLVLGAAVALYLGARDPGWVQQLWYSSPIPWALSASRLSLLCIVIPGTIAGDVILRWTRAGTSTDESRQAGWGTPRTLGLVMLSLAFIPLVLIGLYNRASLPTTQIAAGLVAGGMFLTWRPASQVETMLQTLFRWGAVWLLLGLFLEPFEGGIKKVPETLSYFFTATGLTVMLLVALTATVDALGGRKLVQPLIDIGHNPMLCYVLFTVLLNSVFEMIEPMRGLLRGSPAEALARTGLETLLVVAIVVFMTRRRIFWRT